MPAADKMLIVDGHAYAYRSFHAIRQLSSPSGAPTNAIYGFIKALGKMRAQLVPTHAAVVWDGGLHAQRIEAHPDYKAQRPPMPAGVQAKSGVAPEQIVDWLSLIGDAVDNIPGVPGIGPKTAAELLNQFGSAEALYARLGEVKSDRHRASLQAASAAVRRNQLLIRLRDDSPDVSL